MSLSESFYYRNSSSNTVLIFEVTKVLGILSIDQVTSGSDDLGGLTQIGLAVQAIKLASKVLEQP